MKQKTFYTVLIILLALCAVATLAHLIYAIDAYQRCSIIYFVGKELW